MFTDFKNLAGASLLPFWSAQSDEDPRADYWEDIVKYTTDEQYMAGAMLQPGEEPDEHVERITLCDVHPGVGSILVTGELVTTSHSVTLDLGDGRRVVIEKEGSVTASVYSSDDGPPVYSAILVQ